MKKEISIPQGTKATMYQDGSNVIIEYDEKFEPKPGDVCVNDKGSVFILKKMCKNGAEPYIGFWSDKTFTNGEFYPFGIRLANKEERTKFFERLTKEGYKWDSKKLKLTKKWVPKDGDFVTLDEVWVSIYKEEGIFTVSISDYCGCWISKQVYKEGSDSRVVETSIQHSTPEEKQVLLEAMHSAGKDWDAVNKKVVDYKWKPNEDEIYFYADTTDEDFYGKHRWTDHKIDNFLFDRDLIRKTKEEAIARAKKMLEK